MAFYIRKAFKVGPLRFNLSKSGVGLSAGITGARIGVGPRGSYVHMGRGGLYYREHFGRTSNRAAQPSPGSPQVPPEEALDSEALSPPQVIDSASAGTLTSGAAAAELVAAVQEVRRKTNIVWLVVVVGMLFPLLQLLEVNLAVGAIATLATVVAAAWLFAWGKARKVYNRVYSLDDEAAQQHSRRFAALEMLLRVGRIESVYMEQKLLTDGRRKTVGGAEQRFGVTGVSPAIRSPNYLRTNVSVFALPAGKETLYFLPDMVLVDGGTELGAVTYDDLRVSHDDTRRIEKGPVPRDAEIVEYTWKYKNKSGGPDRRYKDNVQLPITRLGVLTFATPSGLMERFDISQNQVAVEIQQAFAMPEKVLRAVPIENAAV